MENGKCYSKGVKREFKIQNSKFKIGGRKGKKGQERAERAEREFPTLPKFPKLPIVDSQQIVALYTRLPWSRK